MDDSSINNKWDYNLSYNGNPFIANGSGGNTKTVLGSHNLIGVDPLFVNPSIIPNQANFYLQSKSPTINSGTSTSAASLDFEGNKRPLGSACDIGAYEFSFSANITH